MKKKVKYYSRKAIRFILVIVFPVMFISLVTLSKYKPVYSVKFRGESIGLVSSKNEIDSKIRSIIESPQGNIKEATLDEKPEYKLKLANRDKIETEERSVINNIQDSMEKTCTSYEVFVNNKKIGSMSNKKEAIEIIESLKKELGYNEITYKEAEYKQDKKKGEDIKYSSENEIKLAVANEVNAVKAAKLKEEEERQKRLQRLASERRRANERYQAMLAASVGSGNIGLVKSLNFRHPLDAGVYYISAIYGYSAAYGSAFHTGVDFATRGKTPPIYASAPGVVISASYRRGYGNLVVVDHGNGITTYYAHMSQIGASVGQTVSKGQYIGRVGSTGNSTGNHVHFEIRINGKTINPLPYVPVY